MRRGKRRGSLVGWLIVIILGLFLGSYLGSYLAQWMPFFRTTLEVGSTAPVVFNSPLLDLSFSLLIRFNLGALLGMVMVIFIYRRMI